MDALLSTRPRIAIFDDLKRDYSGIPEHMRGRMRAYVEGGIPPGDFLRLCIQNNYHDAAGWGDDINQAHLLDYIKFFYNSVPARCHGSVEAYDCWIAVGGLRGILEGHKNG